MSDDPLKGIVDRNCKVHGMANLYVGGSSAFATSSQCNPTTRHWLAGWATHTSRFEEAGMMLSASSYDRGQG